LRSETSLDIIALDWNTGIVLWSSKLDAPLFTIMIDEDNNIYVTSAFGYIASFTPKGEMRWYYEESEKSVKKFYPYWSRALTHYTTVKLSGDKIVSRGIVYDIENPMNWKSSKILSLSKKDGKITGKEELTGKVMMNSVAGKLGIVTNNNVVKFLK